MIAGTPQWWLQLIRWFPGIYITATFTEVYLTSCLERQYYTTRITNYRALCACTAKWQTSLHGRKNPSAFWGEKSSKWPLLPVYENPTKIPTGSVIWEINVITIVTYKLYGFSFSNSLWGAINENYRQSLKVYFATITWRKLHIHTVTCTWKRSLRSLNYLLQ